VSVSVASDKRFRRAHVAPARRASRSARMAMARHVLAVIAIVVAIYQTAAMILTSGALAVRHISVDGSLRMSRGEIAGVLQDLDGVNILTVDLEAWRQRLRRSPWVSDAHVRRIFPATIRVVVEEREPIGIGRIGDQLFLVDRTGTIIDEFGPNYAELNLPVIDGLAAGNRGGATLVDPSRAALAGRLLRALERSPHLGKLVSQIDVADPGDAAVILDGDTAVVRLGHELFAERLQAYVDVADALRDRVDDIDYVDLRFGKHVYVRPRAGSGRHTLVQGGPARRRSRPSGD
jgi:cell division septal protein FtsQ